MQSLRSLMRFKCATLLLHIALITIVVGACVTHFWGIQGEVHLRADKAQTLTNKYSTISIFLWDFNIIYADDGQTPVDFVSNLRLLNRNDKRKEATMSVDEGIVQMNKPLKYCDYRLCQTNYDSDGCGVVLSYNYDPWGIGITYTGYLLLLVAMIAFFFQRKSYFRALLRKQQRALMAFLGVAIIILAIIMTKVVTPKPPLQPVLQTPLLGIHVSVIMLAYALFGVIMINGIIALCLPAKRQTLMQLSQVLLYPAVFCLTAGIFIGAVWANMSWGRYWGWDPKETWALITMLVYSALLHWPVWETKCKRMQEKGQLYYHLCAIVAFIFVLFTYFGVNYFFGGLHSYA